LMFQFLIGTIKTIVTRNKNSIKFSVSIPHRYDKNLIKYKCKMNIENLMFQFLIGTLKTLHI